MANPFADPLFMVGFGFGLGFICAAASVVVVVMALIAFYYYWQSAWSQIKFLRGKGYNDRYKEDTYWGFPMNRLAHWYFKTGWWKS